MTSIGALTTEVSNLGDRLERRIDNETFFVSKMANGTNKVALQKLDLVERDITEAVPLVKTKYTAYYYAWNESMETQQKGRYAEHLVTLIPELDQRGILADKKTDDWKLVTDLPRR